MFIITFFLQFYILQRKKVFFFFYFFIVNYFLQQHAQEYLCELYEITNFMMLMFVHVLGVKIGFFFVVSIDNRLAADNKCRLQPFLFIFFMSQTSTARYCCIQNDLYYRLYEVNVFKISAASLTLFTSIFILFYVDKVTRKI